MKKLLVLVLVCGLASAANAALSLSIMDNGDGTFDIVQTGTFTATADNSYFFVVADTTGAIPTGGVLGAVPANSFIYDGAVEGGLPVPEGQDGIWGWLGALLTSGTADTAGGVYVSGVMADYGVTVQIWTCDNEFGNQTTMGDAVTLIPEPMTLGLLGLGGLFLRRRK